MNSLKRFSSKTWLFGAVLSLFVVALLFAHPRRASTTDVKSDSKTATSPKPPAEVQINLDKALEVKIPEPAAALRATPFKTPDGKSGWVIRIPGGHAIATPAYSDGMIFVGGGYGSHEFYAFDGQTGAVVWRAKTSDDGPSAAVVENGYVAFNTESCTVVVCQAKTGKVVWQEWLGDPLMSQPAISNGRLYIAYPGGQRGHNQAKVDNGALKGAGRTGHRLSFPP